jgi:predicted nucleic acid-binding protein
LTCLTADLIIAASAMEHEAVLVHSDADFDRIAANSGLRAESLAEAG